MIVGRMNSAVFVLLFDPLGATSAGGASGMDWGFGAYGTDLQITVLIASWDMCLQ